MLAGNNKTVQQLTPIDLSLSAIGSNLFWSPRKPTLRPLFYADAGGGWPAPWRTTVISGLAGLDPAFALSYDAKGYVNTGMKTEENGASLVHRGRWAVLQRDFSTQSLADGVLWVSFLSRRDEAARASDRSVVFFANESG